VLGDSHSAGRDILNDFSGAVGVEKGAARQDLGRSALVFEQDKDALKLSVFYYLASDRVEIESI
jgi:hypothetical protein